MPRITPKYTCKYCRDTKHTLESFQQHVHLCKFLHMTPTERDEQIRPLSMEGITRYLIDLTQKYEKLAETVANLQRNAAVHVRKNVTEYLDTVYANQTFTEWMCKIEVTEENLETMFRTNITEVLQDVLSNALKDADKVPLRAYLQKPNHIYVYERKESDDSVGLFGWRLMTNEDLLALMRRIVDPVVKMYFEWKSENQANIESNERLREENFGYMRKIMDAKSVETKVTAVRKFIISKIQTSLQNCMVDFDE